MIRLPRTEVKKVKPADVGQASEAVAAALRDLQEFDADTARAINEILNRIKRNSDDVAGMRKMLEVAGSKAPASRYVAEVVERNPDGRIKRVVFTRADH